MRIYCFVSIHPNIDFKNLEEKLHNLHTDPYVVKLTKVDTESGEIQGQLSLEFKLDELDQLLDELSNRKTASTMEELNSTIHQISNAAQLEKMIVGKLVMFTLKGEGQSEFVQENAVLSLSTADRDMLAYYLGQHVSGFLQTLGVPHGNIRLQIRES